MKRLPDPTFDQRLADWLEDDPSLAPNEVLGTVLAAVPSIDQRRRSRAPWRYPLMNRSLMPLAAALIVVVGVAYLVLRPAPSVGPAISPSPPAPSLIGTWDVTFTSQELLSAGVIGRVANNPNNYGHFHLTFDERQWQLVHLEPTHYVDESRSYTLDAGTVHLYSPGDTGNDAGYTASPTTLTFLGGANADFRVRSWTRITTEPIGSPMPRFSPLPSDTTTATGTYLAGDVTVPFTVSLPAGWRATDVSANSIALQNAADGKINVYVAVVDKIYADPCKATGASPFRVAIGTVDNVVEEFAAMPGFQVTDVAEATLGAATGKSFRISNTIDPVADGCSGGTLSLLTYVNDADGAEVVVPMFGGEADRFWVLRSGSHTVLVAVTDDPSIVAAAQPVVDSLRFLPR